MFSDKLIILVAPTGNQVDRQGIKIPISPIEIGEEVARCRDAGASIVHIHARDPVTKLASGDVGLFSHIIREIKERSDVLVQTTTSLGLKYDKSLNKWRWHNENERMELLNIEPHQDLLTCPMGSWEFVHPEGGQPVPSTQVNGYAFIKANVKAAIARGLPWEMEIAEIGFLNNAMRLISEKSLDISSAKFWFDFVMGYGGMPATARQLLYILSETLRLFPGARWETNATGRAQFRMNIIGATLGCNIVRVGFEDNVYLPNGAVAKHNYELVSAMAKIARELGREIATPDEARTILGEPSGIRNTAVEF